MLPSTRKWTTDVRLYPITLLVVLFSTSTTAGGIPDTLRPSNEGIVFVPIPADPFYARIGASEDIHNVRTELFAGRSVELFRWAGEDHARYSAGAEFFIWSLLRREPKFRFPVEAADYFFGVTLNSQRPAVGGAFSARLRLSHMSAHAVDGVFDSTYKPRVYSREFVSFAAALERSLFKVSAGLSYLFHSIPDTIGEIQPEFGVQIGVLQGEGFYASGWFLLQKIAAFQSTAVLRAGFLLPADGATVDFFGEYFNGVSKYGSRFPMREARLSAGITVLGW